MPKNIVEEERAQTISRLRVAYWISKPTRAQAHAHARAPPSPHTQKYVLLIAFHHDNYSLVNEPQCYITHILPRLYSNACYMLSATFHYSS